MRVILREMDNIIAPALAMLASNRLAAPRFIGRDPEELEKELQKIPLPERREAWRKLMFQATPPEDLAESRRRVGEGIDGFERLLADSPWLAGETFSLADIGVFATFHSLPLGYPELLSEERPPRLWDWLGRCHARPGLSRGFTYSRGMIGQRAAQVRELLKVPASA